MRLANACQKPMNGDGDCTHKISKKVKEKRKRIEGGCMMQDLYRANTRNRERKEGKEEKKRNKKKKKKERKKERQRE